MKDFIVIIPYFGKFPNYFNLFLNSVIYNNKIDFLLITDNNDNYDYPENMSVINMSFDDFSSKVKDYIKSYFDIDVILDHIYKICDYRPFFGDILHEYTSEYCFWGYCDVDIIFGEIQKQIFNIPNYRYYDMIAGNGHFTLINNKVNISELIKNSKESREYFSYKEVLKYSDYSFHYDEYNGLDKILELNNNSKMPLYSFAADIDFRYESFYLLTENFESNEEEWYFEYTNGKLIGYSSSGVTREFLYIHLQKRKMELLATNKNHFYIIPNKFLDNINDFNYSFEKKTIEYPYHNITSFYYTKEYVINNSSIIYDGTNFDVILDDFINKNYKKEQ